MKKRLSKQQYITIIILFVLVVVLGIALAVFLYYDGMFTEGTAGKLPDNVQTEKPTAPEEVREGQQNILICAIDFTVEENRDYADGKGLTDVMLYVNLRTDKDGKVSANVLQIPRDTYVGFDRSPNGRLNGIYANGPDQTNLIANLANELNRDFALPVDDYVVFNMDVFREIINTIGGIDIYVPWDVYSLDANGAKIKEIKQGQQRLSGDDAAWLVRQREMYAQKDYKRLELQQYFYKAVFQTIRKDFPLSEAPVMAKRVAHYCNTDMNLSDLIGMFTKVMSIQEENIFIVRAPGGSLSVENPATGKKESPYGINADNFAPILNEHFRYASSPVPASAFDIPTGFTYALGETHDKGKTLGDIATTPENAG